MLKEIITKECDMTKLGDICRGYRDIASVKLDYTDKEESPEF